MYSWSLSRCGEDMENLTPSLKECCEGTNPMLFRTDTWQLHLTSYMMLLQEQPCAFGVEISIHSLCFTTFHDYG